MLGSRSEFSYTALYIPALPEDMFPDIDSFPEAIFPVMATLNDGSSLLLIGFNDLNTVLLEPTKGEVYKLGRNDTAALFESNGNHFVTYLPGVSK